MNVYSASSFCSDSELLYWKCKVCAKVERPIALTVIDNPATNVRGYVGYVKSSNRIIVAFRGTKDVKNWIEDLSF